MKKEIPDKGVIVGTNRNQEWLLPWWWMNYAVHNAHPVTFFDFGDMSEEAAAWCRKHGSLIKLDISTSFVAGKEAIDPRIADIWWKIYNGVWEVRPEWWKKPFAYLKSPYQKTIWMDLDCQVRGSISPLFETCDNEAGIAIVPEPDWCQEINLKRGFLIPGETLFNSGVLVFDKNSPIIKELAEQSVTRNDQFLGDQQLLSRILFSRELEFTTLPSIYNWLLLREADRKAIIVHWCGSTKGAMETLFNSLQEHFLINLTFQDP